MVDSITVYQGNNNNNSNLPIRSTTMVQQAAATSGDTTVVTQARRRWLSSVFIKQGCKGIGWIPSLRRIVRLYSYTMLLGWFLLVIAVKQGWFILKIVSLILCGSAVIMFIIKEVDRLSRRQHPIGVPLTISSEVCRILEQCSRPAIYGRIEVGGECPLCIRKMRSEATVVELSTCGHAMHSECLKSFIKYSSPLSTRTCPLCNRPFITPQTIVSSRTSLLPLQRGIGNSSSSMVKTIQLKKKQLSIGNNSDNENNNNNENIPTTSTLPVVSTPPPQSSRSTVGYYYNRREDAYYSTSPMVQVPTV